jgi:hypothetical protein
MWRGLLKMQVNKHNCSSWLFGRRTFDTNKASALFYILFSAITQCLLPCLALWRAKWPNNTKAKVPTKKAGPYVHFPAKQPNLLIIPINLSIPHHPQTTPLYQNSIICFPNNISPKILPRFKSE